MRDDRELISVVFEELLQVVMNVFRYQNQGVKMTPGITAVLHTFGEDMKFNVHFHCIVTEGGVNAAGEWTQLNFFFYEALRKVWQYHVLTAIKRHLPKTRENSLLIDKLFKDHPKGFYVHAKRRVNNDKGMLQYIARYVRHPAIAQSRIINFDGEQITFICKEHEDKPERKVVMPVQQFLSALVQHIPPKGFQMVKHLGLYANKSRRKYASVISMFAKQLKFVQKKLFQHAPKCQICDSPMQLSVIAQPTDPPRHLLLSSYAGQLTLSLLANLRR